MYCIYIFCLAFQKKTFARVQNTNALLTVATKCTLDGETRLYASSDKKTDAFYSSSASTIGGSKIKSAEKRFFVPTFIHQKNLHFSLPPSPSPRGKQKIDHSQNAPTRSKKFQNVSNTNHIK